MKISYRIARSCFLFTTVTFMLGFAPCAGTAIADDTSTPAKSGAGNDAPGGAAANATPVSSDKDGSVSSTSVSDGENGSGSTGNSETDESSPPLKHKHKDSLVPLPGQKVKIAGFAQGQKITIVPDSAGDKPASYHRVQMRLTGSMCHACMLEFQEKLQEISGVERARVAKSEQASVMPFSPDLGNWADAVLIYDANKVDFVDLKAFIRSNAYYPYKVVDREIQSLPADDQKKF